MIKLFKQRLINISKSLLPYNLRIFLRKLNWKILYIQQSMFTNEFNFYCPIDNKKIKLFIKARNNFLSPLNGANARQRLVWLYLKNELDIFKKKYKLLHIAPELCYFEKLSKFENINYFPGDKMVNGYSNQKGVLDLDITQIDFKSNFFDIIICNHVLEHIDDDKTAISEMYRVLNKGGKAIITVPINEKINKTYENKLVKTASERIKHFGQWDHVRWYGLDIKERISKAGFKVELNRYSNKFSKKEILRQGLSKSLIITAIKN